MRKLSLAVLLSAAIHGYLLNVPSKAKEITLTSGGQTAAPSLSIEINTQVVSKPVQQSPKPIKPIAPEQPPAKTPSQAAPAKAEITTSQTPIQSPAPKPNQAKAKPDAPLKKASPASTKALPKEKVEHESQVNQSLPANPTPAKPTQPQQVKETPLKPTKPTSKPEQQPETQQLASSQVNSQPQQQQGLSQLPRLNSQPRFAQPPTAPSYPRLAKKRGLEGTVMVEVWLDRHGRQTKREISNSSGVKSLDKAALKAVQQWKFKALIIDGQAQASRAVIPIRFNLS